MKRILISALSSGSGKTTVACALLRCLDKRGIPVEGFKCGPDYIDPMFHRKVLGVPCKNLDIFLEGKEGMLQTLHNQWADVAVLEGAMGYYDGANGSEEGSAWNIAALTDTPVLLVLNPKGEGVTLVAEVRGLQNFRSPDQIAGLVLNNCSERQYAYLCPILKRECGLPVLGYLPPMEECSFESRHLGLVTAEETTDFNRKIDALAQALETNCNVDALLSLCKEIPRNEQKGEKVQPCCRIAVARDAAFCFYYEENLSALESAGAELVFFSPMKEKTLPRCDGLYLGGGYPELHAQVLSENEAMRSSIKNAVLSGLPTVAECGGFLYLQQSLDGLPMVGLCPGKGEKTSHLQRFGYLKMRVKEDSLLFLKGEEVPAHEFHYWDCTDNGSDLLCRKENGKEWTCGFCNGHLYAAFPHLHFGGKLPMAVRFTKKAREYKEQNQ